MFASKLTRALPRVLCLTLFASAAIAAVAVSPDEAMLKKMSTLAVPFVPNAGQWDARAAFAARTFAGTLFVTTDGQLVYSLSGTVLEPVSDAKEPLAVHRRGQPSQRGQSVLTETLIDGDGRAVALTPQGSRPQATRVSSFIKDDPSAHRGPLATYEQLSLGELAPGVHLDLRATGSNVEKIFTVAPTRDPGAIRVRLDGAERLELGTDGALRVYTNLGPVDFTAPIAYQEDGQGRRSAVDVRYLLADASKTYTFELGAYDHSRPLIIDPLLQATYLGGGNNDIIFAIAVHPVSGEVLVAGYTDSVDLPCTTIALGCGTGAQPANAPNGDGFVARLNASLTSLLQVTFLGGSSTDTIRAIAIHPISGEVLVAGDTLSFDLPCTTIAAGCATGAQPAHAVIGGGFGHDGFVARLNANLTSLLQVTYLGGSRDDQINAITVHPVSGEVVVAGQTISTNLTFTAGGAQPLHAPDAGSYEGFVVRLNASLTSVLQGTYLGGNSDDALIAVAAHPVTGQIVVAGYTRSNNLPCATPATPGCAYGAQPTPLGLENGFVGLLNANLTSLQQVTYLGGTNAFISTVVIHPVSGEVLVAGSASNDFPCTSTATPGCGNGAQPTATSTGDHPVVVRLNAGLTTRLQATYLSGGAGVGLITAIAIHPVTGEVLVAGYTSSPVLPCTTTTTSPCGIGAQAAHATTTGGSGFDGFVARINANLTGMLQTTFLGGGDDDFIRAMTIHPLSGEVLVAGETFSTNLPCTSPASGCANGAQPAMAGGRDGFVARLTADLTLNDSTPDAFAFVPQINVPAASVRISSPVLIAGIIGTTGIYVDGQPGSAYCVSSTPSCSCDVSGAYLARPDTIATNQFVCVRHTSSAAPNRVTYTNLHVGGAMATFNVSTGSPLGNCSLDVDGNNSIGALTDGLIILRAMFGLTGTAVTNAAVGSGATRQTWAAIQPYLNGNCGTSFAP